jgi:hypothetical protein
MKILFLFLIILVTAYAGYSQQSNDSLSVLNKRFLSFQYEKTIAAADSMLKDKNNYSNDLLIEIFKIKGIAHFSLLEDSQAEDSFLNILKIDSAYTLDTAKTSPKIITFFNRIKNNYQKESIDEEKLKAHHDTVFVTKILYDPEAEQKVKNYVYRSIILPGWGHLYKGENVKGVLLTSLSSITLISSLYFIIDSNKKEDEYRSVRNLSDIAGKYDKYNRSYKIKNYSLIAFAAVWLYAQIDLLFFSTDNKGFQNERILPDAGFKDSGIDISVKIPLY